MVDGRRHAATGKWPKVNISHPAPMACEVTTRLW